MKLLEQCQDANIIGISGHIRPDGDCIGSCLALYLYLKRAFKTKEIYVYLEKPSDTFGNLVGVNDIDSTFQAKRHHDVFFVLDSESNRIGGAEAYYLDADIKINIDHHISNQGHAPISVIEPQASSTAEVLFGLMEYEFIDAEIAKALYIGIIHDSGVFQYSNTSEKTLTIASKLITFGFDFSKLIQETFYQRTFLQAKLLGRALEEFTLLYDGRVSLCGLSKEILDEFGATSKDMEGFVNQILNIKGVDCAIFLYETEDGYKVSMRANEKINVSVVAVSFGGGGHVRASGCTLKGEYKEIVEKLTAEIAKQL